jgi:hypothetical protein
MNKSKMIMALAFAILAIAPMSLVLISEQSEAYLTISDDIRGDGFSTSGDGTLHIPFSNNTGMDVTLTALIVKEGNNEVYRATNVIVPEGGGTVDLHFKIGSKGDHNLTVVGEPNDAFYSPDGVSFVNSNTVTISVKESVLSKPSTYVAIAVVAILIVIAAYMYMRNAPTKKPDTTFTELEQQKRVSKGEVDSAPKASATEKRRYDKASATEPPKEAPKEKASKKEAVKPEPAPEEKKATTFTELEKEKSAKKEASVKKDSSSSEEPKKLKYVSSRRK